MSSSSSSSSATPDPTRYCTALAGIDINVIMSRKAFTSAAAGAFFEGAWATTDIYLIDGLIRFASICIYNALQCNVYPEQKGESENQRIIIAINKLLNDFDTITNDSGVPMFERKKIESALLLTKKIRTSLGAHPDEHMNLKSDDKKDTKVYTINAKTGIQLTVDYINIIEQVHYAARIVGVHNRFFLWCNKTVSPSIDLYIAADPIINKVDLVDRVNKINEYATEILKSISTVTSEVLTPFKSTSTISDEKNRRLLCLSIFLLRVALAVHEHVFPEYKGLKGNTFLHPDNIEYAKQVCALVSQHYAIQVSDVIISSAEDINDIDEIKKFRNKDLSEEQKKTERVILENITRNCFVHQDTFKKLAEIELVEEKDNSVLSIIRSRLDHRYADTKIYLMKYKEDTKKTGKMDDKFYQDMIALCEKRLKYYEELLGII